MTLHKFVIPFNSIEDISDKDLLDLHRKYWRFIGDHILLTKPDIVFMNGEFAHITNQCFLCEYARRRRVDKDKNICRFCPVEEYRWVSFGCEHSDDSPYRKWVDFDMDITDDEGYRILPYMIANLGLVET